MEQNKKVVIPPQLSHLICSFPIAERLKKYGLLQCAAFSYFEAANKEHGEHIGAGCCIGVLTGGTDVSAFLATELVYAIGHGYPKPDLMNPNLINRHQEEGTFAVYMVSSGKFFMNHADACADFLLQLIDAGAVTVDEVNARLQKFCLKDQHVSALTPSTELEIEEQIKEMAWRMSLCEKMNTPDELQFYENNKAAIERELKKLAI